MDSIWKFQLEVTDEQLIEMPVDAEILDVQTQNGIPCLWARVDPTAEKIKRSIITHGTGHVVPETTGIYLGSYQMEEGMLVCHVFEGNPT